ncbi:MAG: hypothetical protein PHD91_02125 [bacterium]|jgi:DNA polymerase III delta subunit|nr:hypothetical protein [bacterium]MDD3805870.1 hypothetical protein [bacterium]MDD4152501.1 hypothetical protein [bacterium]MDD4558229.1 hypothetical protein [bacterium]
MKIDAYNAVAFLKKEAVMPIYLLAGPGDFPYEGLLRMIASRVIGPDTGLRDMDNLNLSVSGLADALDEASTLSLFGGGQVLLLRSPQAISDADIKLLEQYLESPDPATVIVILFTYDREDEQGGRIPAPKASLARLVEKRGVYINLTFASGKKYGHDAQETERLLRLIGERGRRAGKRFSRSAAQMLIDMAGGSAGLLFSEADKAIAYVGAEEEIKPADIVAIGCHNAEADIFEMIDGLGQGKRAQALKIFSRLWEMLPMPDSGKAIYIVTMLARHFRFLLQGAALKREEKGKFLPEDKKISLAAQHPFVQRKIALQAAHYGLRRAAQALVKFHQLDRDLKSGAVIDERSSIELLLVSLQSE